MNNDKSSNGSMTEHTFKEEILNILRLLSSKEDLTQRDVSNHLGISLGKTNYLLKSLIKIGLLEIKNFATRDKKIKKIQYFLTKEGLRHKAELTYHFLKRKEEEYNRIKKEWEELNHSAQVK